MNRARAAGPSACARLSLAAGSARSASVETAAAHPFATATATATAAARVGRPTVHLADLDALRGVAAVLVLLFHCSERAGLPFLCPRGYLAVDLFFTMSGYVLMHAYGDALLRGRLGLGRFVAMRVIRLGPMIVLGTTIAALVELGRPTAVVVPHLVDTGEAWIRGCLLLPIFRATTLEHVVYPLNGPAWSLFFELVANVVFAWLLVRGAGRATLAICLVASLAALVAYLASHPTLEYAGGVSTSFAAGLPRVGLAFSLGVLLFAARARIRLPIGRRTGALLFVLLCMVPPLRSPACNAAVDLAAVLLVLPGLVLASGQASLVGRPDPAALWSGRISYPLYAIHYPFVRAAGRLILQHHLGLSARLAAVAALTLVLLALAAALDLVFDRPARARLARLLPAR